MSSLHRRMLPAVLALAATCGTVAAATLSYHPGDLLLAFRASSDPGQNSNYIVNLGPASAFRDATTSFNLNVGDIGADLTVLYGPTWYSRADVFWSVTGASSPTTGTTVNGDAARTLYATKVESTLGTVGTPWNLGSSATQSAPTNRFNAMGLAYEAVAGVPNTSTSNSSVGFIQASTATNSYSSFGPTFSYFVSAPSGVEGSSPTGIVNSALDLFRMPTGSSASLGTYEGTFTISQSGQVTFNVVPEPSVALLGAFALLAPVFHRRRQLA